MFTGGAVCKSLSAEAVWPLQETSAVKYAYARCYGKHGNALEGL